MATAPDSTAAPARTRLRSRIGRAFAGWWEGIEADAETWRKVLGEIYGVAPAP